MARAPKAPIRWSDALPSNLDAKLEAAIAQAVADFQRTAGTNDGTRSEQVVRWASEFERAAADESEVAA